MGSEARLRLRPDYSVTALAAGPALVLQFMLIPWFGGDPNSSPFMVYFAAVLVASWLEGIGKPPSTADRIY